jgi:copper oxidase (laccase) domain-containing protein
MNLHVGWRGAKSKIIEKSLQTVLKNSGQNKAHLWVVVSPMIRSCCYQVGSEFYDYFGEQYLQQRESKIYFDLPHLIEKKLTAGGVSASQIEFSRNCTCCSSLRLPSFRRDKTKSRIINIIEIKEN